MAEPERLLRPGLLIAMAICLAGTAQAQPVLRVLRFTADWCPTCRVLDPRIEAAVRLAGPDGILVSDFDQTDAGARPVNARLATAWKADDIWQAYQGRTGFAVVTSQATGAPIACLGLPMPADRMADKLQFAMKYASAEPAGPSPFLDDCPDHEAR